MPVALALVVAHAVVRDGDITVDGKLDEPVWASAPKQSGFTQRFPADGVPPTYDTEFAIVYDDKAIYVGVWAHDPHPDELRRLLVRRDVDATHDSIAVAFDSYDDHRTAYGFGLNAAGVQNDFIVYDDTTMDTTWDAVWTGDVAVTPDGWTAEFRIPTSQLRYGSNPVWGLQVFRYIGRLQEQSTWSPWPRSTPQIVSRFGELTGIHVPPTRRLELLPYATGGVALQPGDPLNPSVDGRGGVGLDLKYGLGPAFTLSATINPDFGQVEADPSEINLSANELFFAEKRPFFVEGVDLFRLPTGAPDEGNESLFYSRRIGAQPPGEPGDATYVSWPASTTIYGAAKLSGKTASGWSIGVLDAITGEADATVIDPDEHRLTPEVAPLTSYAVARVKRDFRGGKTSIGLAATAVDRRVAGTSLAFSLHDQAYTGGAQLEHRWDDDAWQLSIRSYGSFVHGTPEAIAHTQESNVHLFQRPDATDVHFDPTRTSLSGGGLGWDVGRTGDTEHWRVGIGGLVRSPGVELNDIGFQTYSDRVESYLWGEYRDDAPSDTLLNYKVDGYVYAQNNFEPTLTNWGVAVMPFVQFANYWSINAGLFATDNRWDMVALRGGPALRLDPNANGYASITSDTRERVWVSVSGNANRIPASDTTQGELDAGVTVQARPNLDVYVGPSWAERDDAMQFVATSNGHYILARIDQTTVSATFRVNWTFSPHLSLQAYAQPFVASGRYSEFKDVDNPHADRFADRFHLLQGNDLHLADGTYFGSGFQFARPDFDLRQLRSIVVLRWEYRPGSTLFAIWSQGRTSAIDDGRFRLGRDLAGLAGADGEHVLMVKLNYWIGL